MLTNTPKGYALTILLKPDEMRSLSRLSLTQDLSDEKVMIQALRLYELSVFGDKDPFIHGCPSPE